MNILEKNPKKGGTPAIEKKQIENIVLLKTLNFKLFNMYKVLLWFKVKFKKLQNKKIKEKLYINK